MKLIPTCLNENAAAAIAITACKRPNLTYYQLSGIIGSFRSALRSAGIRQEDKVAVVLPEGPDGAVAILATAMATACAPLNPAYSEEQYRAMLGALGAKAVITSSASGSHVAAAALAAGIRVIELEFDPAGPVGAFSLAGQRLVTNSPLEIELPVPPSPDDIALILFTSGTVARPKLVPLSHRNIAAAANSIRLALQLGGEDRCLGTMPLFHIHGLSTLFASIAAGGSFVSLSGFSTAGFYESLQSLRPTWYSASPTIHRAVLDNIDLFQGDMRQSGLRFIRSASAPMPQGLIADIERTFAVPFIEAYGMTEAAPQISSNRLPPFPRKPGSVGTAAGPDIQIMDAGGQHVTLGQVGEVVVRGENVMSGYLDDPAANRDAFVDGWLRTGDLGRMDEEGFLFITGRLKEIINRGGEKISPRKIDDVLLQHPAILHAATFAVPHAALGENVAAAVVLKVAADNPQTLTEEIQHFAAQHLAPFEVPHQLIFVDSLPLGPSGKLVRNKLADMLGLATTGGPFAQASEPTAPRSPTERRIAQVIAEVLKTAAPGIYDDFFAIGGHSLTAMQVVVRLGQIFHVALSIDSIFQFPTVAQLAKVIGERMADMVAEGAARLDRPRDVAVTYIDVGIPKRAAAAPAPLSYAQERLYFMDQIGAGSAYNMSASLRLRGPLDHGALSSSLDEIVRRHESLRTTFQLTHDRPVLHIAAHQPLDLETIELTGESAERRENELYRIATAAANRPFGLGTGPLFRPLLLRISAEDHVLLLQMHHIVSDGWSISVLQKELRRLYSAFSAGRASPLEPLTIQFADFSAWQRDQQNHAEMAGQIGYWGDQLRGAPLVCTFPADRPRLPIKGYRGASYRTQIDRSVVERLREISQAEHVTPFMTLLAAFKSLLSRLSGQEDCVVGVPIANRPRKELEPLIGFFASTLVLRTSLSADPTFADLLTRIRATALGAYAHQDVPLEKLFEELGTRRDSSHTPLFQVMFALQNLPDLGTATEFSPGIAAQPYVTESRSAKFDLTLYLTDLDDGAMAATWQYDTDLYDASTIERFASQFTTLLQSIAKNYHRPLSELPIQSDELQRKIEIDWNLTDVAYLHRRSFLELFAAQVLKTPDSSAVSCGRDTLTYRALDRRASEIARHLGRFGFGPGTLIGVCLPRSVEHIAALLGVWKAGAGFLPLDPSYPPERLSFMLADSAATLLLTEPDLHHHVATPQLQCLYLNDVMAEGNSAELSDTFRLPGVDDLAYVIYTSGSTGRPKGVKILHGNVCHYAQAMVAAMGLTAQDRYLHTASFAFSSSIRQFTTALSCGAAVVVAPADAIRDPQALFDLVKEKEVSVIDLVPSMWSTALQVITSLDSAEQSAILNNSLRLALSASEPLPSRVAHAWRALFKLGVRQINMFGQTETTGIVATYSIPPQIDAAATVPIGRPIANTQLYVLDTALRISPIGVVGELYVGGAGVGGGYINQPELTARNFIIRPFTASSRLYRTGDLARYRDDGVLELLGRSDGQIKVRGFRIEPSEIENVVASHPDVNECVVVAIGNATSATPSLLRLVAFVTPRGVDADLLRDFLRARLPEYMVPSGIYIFDQLPRTPNSKIDKKALQSSILERGSTEKTVLSVDQKPPGQKLSQSITEARQILATVWQDVLHRERVGPDENFFDLGGNSLLTITVVMRVKRAGLLLTLQQLYQHQTIAELARAVCEHEKGGQGDPSDREQPSRQDSPKTESEAVVLVTAESLRAFGVEALMNAGLDRAGAEIVTEVQLEASLRDQPTHNIVSIPRYAKRLAVGKINPRPNIRIEQETAFSASIDGDNGPGQWVSTFAMDVAIRKARECGVSMVAVRRSNHFGAAGQYVWQAVNNGLIGLCTTNGPVILAPTGGVTPTFGNNPIGVGIPAARHFPILLDIAISVAPRGRIGLAVAEGRPLPPGWILDRHGRPSTDLADLAAGLGVPIGGHKGYGLALVMEVLSGALTGAKFCGDHHRDKLHGNTQAPDYGHFFMVVHPKLFMPPQQFADRVDEIIDQTKAGPLAEGASEILIPGEMELRARERSLKEGVRLRPSTLRTLLSYAKDARLTTQLEIIAPSSGDGLPNIKVSPVPFERSELEGSIVARFKRVAATNPDQLALCDERSSLTYAALDRRCDQIAAAILAKVKPGSECVAILVDHSAAMVICALAAIRAGKAYLCIHPQLPAEAQKGIVRDAVPGILLTCGDNHRANAAMLAKDICNVLPLESIDLDESPSITASGLGPADPAAIFYTSGSTGRPKGVLKSHRAVLHRAWLSARYDAVTVGDRQSLLTYCSFASSEADVFGALLNGATVELFDSASRSLDEFAAWIDRRRITLLHPPVIMFRRFLETLQGAALYPTVRLIALAGEAATPADVQRWRQHFSPECALRHRFSSTEAGHIAVACIDSNAAITGGGLSAAMAVSDKTLLIVDESGQPVGTGVDGELIVRSAFLADGYWRNAAATQRDFIADLAHPGERSFRTGDIGRLLADGRFEFVGRRDSQVKVRGYRVELREIEQTLLQFPGVKEGVVAVERRQDENRLIAFFVPSGEMICTVHAIRTALQARMPSWKVPADFVAIESMPLTLNGKIDRQTLLAMWRGKPSPDELPRIDPFFGSSPIAATLLAIWQQLLGRSNIGPDDIFFHIGGHSLMAAQLMHHIKVQFSRSLPLAALFAAPTIRQLTELLSSDTTDKRATTVEIPLAVLLKDGGDRPPLFCLPPLNGSPLTYVKFARYITADQPVYGLRFADNESAESLQQLAASFIEHIRRVAPHGPYRLCGHSYGGTLAYEIARQLAQSGASVDYLALFDSRVPGSRRPQFIHQRLSRHVLEAIKEGPRNSIQYVVNRLKAHRLSRSKPDSLFEKMNENSEARQMAAARSQLFQSATLSRYDGPMTLFRASQPQSGTERYQPQRFNGWDVLCDHINLHAVPGDHLSIMNEPDLPVLCGVLNEDLQRISNK